MKRARMCAIVTLALVLALTAVPAAALANGWVVERGLLGGIWAGGEWAGTDVSGHWAVYLYRDTIPSPGLFQLEKIDLRTGGRSIVATDAVDGIESPAVDGDWVAYAVGGDIRVENLVTGVVKKVTNDGGATSDAHPAISGKYVVWEVDHGLDIDIWGKDFTSTKAKFLVAGGTGNQMQPSISGARVAYRDEAGGDLHGQIKIKTIGSSSAAWNITSDAGNHSMPSIGDHLVAWLSPNGDGRAMIRTYNYDTRQWVYGPTSASVDMRDPQVAGDRILYGMSNGSDLDLYVFDVRARRADNVFARSFAMPNTSADELAGRIAGNSCVYLSNGWPVWAKLEVPSVTIAPVPKRVPRHGHIHLKGTVSDQGMPLGKAPLRIEKYSGGRWVLVTTITSSSTGSYSYKTATLHAKTKFRVAYDGKVYPMTAGIAQHFSSVSAVRTGWPR